MSENASRLSGRSLFPGLMSSTTATTSRVKELVADADLDIVREYRRSRQSGEWRCPDLDGDAAPLVLTRGLLRLIDPIEFDNVGLNVPPKVDMHLGIEAPGQTGVELIGNRYRPSRVEGFPGPN